ncbi:glycylpeptide N-tetradecanoyltransferase [Eremomyces bilateralis CBS 781.70]|uniref:Glycylpeptide N-tetradecanoyltransferase n=1 Tax=Eremomyces bilateralis CBS 781.70 TaxID=1392243 RepID=A0A6G1G8L6_9PEZI|nr:glycylpeptide N-tetradecanoyltransferase [Eremomyces bilateralis CBS 781.70]KAF1814384.1 glycylpeptide N-tetradecanoyltransferase [Eremomyces bilateralis CBS 781.70]
MSEPNKSDGNWSSSSTTQPEPPVSTTGQASAGDQGEGSGMTQEDSQAAGKKRKKSKAKHEGPESEGGTDTASDNQQLQNLIASNPTLKKHFAGLEPEKMEEALRKLKLEEILSGMSPPSAKRQKDMAGYKFWKTQPVPAFDDQRPTEEGPIKMIEIDRVSKKPAPLIDGFEWVTMNLDDPAELSEVYELLSHHYVEDDEAMFRFNYSPAFFTWALKAPGWTKDWHIGVRATKSRKLVAFISGIPIGLRVRKTVLKSSEINFLCIHKKLRSNRLAPVLIKEVTRRCYQIGTFQAIYTVGHILPTPVSTCRYYHRCLDWEKLYEVGFSPLPSGSTVQRQIIRYKLPTTTSTPGLRPMKSKDVPAVQSLLKRYLDRFELAQEFTEEEVEHWLVHHEDSGREQVVWAYVVEEENTHRITDFFSFYNLESTVIGHKKHNAVRAAYSFYYASEKALTGNMAELKVRLNELMKDALILAKNAKFDVFNALSLLDNPLFLDDQKFGMGDGRLHYYLYNYRAAPIQGGLDAQQNASEKHMGGIGVVML